MRGPGVAADAQDLGGSGQPVPSAGAVRMVRFSRRPWPFSCSVHVESANCSSVQARAAVIAASSDGWFALMNMQVVRRQVLADLPGGLPLAVQGIG